MNFGNFLKKTGFVKEHSFAYILFAVLIKAMIAIVLGLIYWSQVVQEERFEAIEESLKQIKEQLHGIQNLPSQIKEMQSESLRSNTVNLASSSHSSYIDDSLPNLLVLDPYFNKTLPDLLGPNFKPHGTLRMAIMANDANFHPFSQWAHINEFFGYCQGGVANHQFGMNEILAQDFAIKVEERPCDLQDRATIWVHLRDNLFWQPLQQGHFPSDVKLAPHFLKKTKLTAYDFQFWWQALSNPYVDEPAAVILRQLMQDIEKIEVVDDLTFIVFAKKLPYTDSHGNTTMTFPYALYQHIGSLRPLARFVYQYLPDGTKICSDDSDPDFYAKSALWAQNFAHHFALRVIPSCGPWVFDGASDKQIRFRRNRDYYNQFYALYDAVEVYFLQTMDASWRDFMAQKIDVCTLTPNNLIELERFQKSSFYEKLKKSGREIKRLDYLMRGFSYIGWNEKKPYFSSKKTRQALDMAIDCKRLIRQNLNGQGVQISGPFFIGSVSYDQNIHPYPYDPERAKELLAEDGWTDTDGDGILDKEINGKRVPFRFTLTYFVNNQITKANCELISTFLKQIGIDCRLNGVELNDLSAVFDDKSFDAYALAWTLNVVPDNPYQLWHSSGANEKGSSNAIGFSNKEADRLIEQLLFEKDLKEREILYHKLHAILYDEAPYAFLFSTKSTLLYWNDIQNIFIPEERQDLVPGADVTEPSVINSWKKEI